MTCSAIHTRHARSARVAAIGCITLATMFASACTPSKDAKDDPRVVDIHTVDGVALKGTLFTTGKAGPAVLMLHQCDAQRKVWDSLGVHLRNAGITALSIDYRGYGESGGVAHDKLTPQEATRLATEVWPADIDSAFAFMLRQPGVSASQIGVAGGSCGVNNAVQVAERHKDVKALALLAGGADHAARAFIAEPNAPPVFTAAARDDGYANFIDIMSWLYGLSPNKESRSVQYDSGGHAAIVMKKHPEMTDTIAKWFNAVLTNKPQLLPVTNGKMMDASVIATLREMDTTGGATTITQRLIEQRKQNPNAQLFPEYYANQIGYEHLQAGDVAGAIAIMKLNATAYPNSPNAMDSLGDTYVAAGDTTHVVEVAKRTLALLVTDTSDTPERKKALHDAANGKVSQFTKH